MIRYFRINDPYRLVGLFVLLLLLYLPLFLNDGGATIPELKALLVGEKQNEDYAMYSGVVDNTGPLAAWVHELLDSLFGRSVLVRHIMAFLLIFMQGAYLGIMLISKKVFNENTYIPSFIFSLLFFFSFDTLALSAELMGSGFLLLALNNLFQEIEFRSQGDEGVFSIGLTISLASLFAWSFTLYLFCAIAVLLLFTRSTPRKFLLLIFGFLLPHLLALSIAFVLGTAGELWQYFYIANFTVERTEFVSVRTLLTLSAIPLAYFVISIIMLNRESRFSKYQSMVMQVMLIWIGFSFVFTLLTKELRPQSLIVFIPGLAVLFTHFFLLIRRKKFVALNSWLLFLGIVSVAYLGRFGKIDSIDYGNLMVTGDRALRHKKLLVLGSELELYHQNYLATPYLNWELSKEIFRNPDYYEHATLVYHALQSDPPDVILDKENLMEKFFDRMPALSAHYVRQGDRYIKTVSN